MDNAKYVEGISGSLKDIIKADVNSGNERTQIEYLDWALDNLKRRYRLSTSGAASRHGLLRRVRMSHKYGWRLNRKS